MGTAPRRAVVLGVAALLIAGSAALAAGTGTATAAPAADTSAVAWQGNPLHDGDVPDQGLPATPVLKWHASFDNQVSYPVIAGGRMFVLVGGYSSGPPAEVMALDAATGRPLWGPTSLTDPQEHAAEDMHSGLAYDEGRVFAVDDDGDITAFDAASGAIDWTSGAGGQVTASPTAYNGVLYVAAGLVGGTLTALSETTGRVLWSSGTDGIGFAAPTVTDSGVYIGLACEETYDFAPLTGRQLWWHQTGCFGGGGSTAVEHDGKIYIRDSGHSYLPAVLDEGTGATTTGAVFPDRWSVPAFDGEMEVAHSGQLLQADDVTTGATLWTHQISSYYTAPPLIVGHTIYAANSTGGVEAIDEHSGLTTWTAQTGIPIDGLESFDGLAAGDGVLAVPATDDLFVYGAPASTPPTVGSSPPPSPSPGVSSTPAPAPASAAPTVFGPLPSSVAAVVAAPVPHCVIPSTRHGETPAQARSALTGKACDYAHDVDAPTGWPNAPRGKAFEVTGFALETVSHVRHGSKTVTVRHFTHVPAAKALPARTSVSLIVTLVRTGKA